MTKIKSIIENICVYVILFLQTLLTWLPFMSPFILIGAVIYGLLSQWVGVVMMLGVPLTFCSLKTWADATA